MPRLLVSGNRGAFSLGSLRRQQHRSLQTAHDGPAAAASGQSVESRRACPTVHDYHRSFFDYCSNTASSILVGVIDGEDLNHHLGTITGKAFRASYETQRG